MRTLFPPRLCFTPRLDVSLDAADLTTRRLDKPDKVKAGADPIFAEDYDSESPLCILKVNSLQLPLIDLVIPPLTAKDDIDPDYYEDFSVEDYVKEYYDDVKYKDWAMEEVLAEIHDATGCLM